MAFQRPHQSFWRDKDRRRAALLSLLLHLGVLLLFTWALIFPSQEPEETFLVIDIGTPAPSETVTQAPTAQEAAPQAQEAQAADTETGEPQAQMPPRVAAPSPPPETPQAPVLEPEPQSPPAAQSAPELAEAPAEAPETEPEPEAAAEPEAIEPAPVPPPPQATVPETSALQETLPELSRSALLPEIEEPEISPQPLEDALAIPAPNVTAEVPQARVITTEPELEVAQERALPQPEISASVAPAVTVPEPQVSVTTASSRTIPQPSVSASAAAPTAIPQPQVSADVAQAAAIPQPQVSASVAAPTAVPQPQVSVSTGAAQPIAQPQISTSVAAASTIPQPGVETSVAPGRAVTVVPGLDVAAPRPLPQPQVSAVVTRAPSPDPVAAEASLPDAPAGASALPSNRTDNRPQGANADRPGQTRAEAEANLANLGAAAGPEGAENPTGAPLEQARTPYSEFRNRPLAVLIDNADAAYPQMGLREASMVIEMPVEGGLTRLMTVYDLSDPGEIGPVRSARDYFHELAESLNGILVHDGGSPGALAAIERSELPTFNAFRQGDLFARKPDRSAPHNLYATGSALRQAVNRLRLNQTRNVNGLVYRPDEAGETVAALELDYSAAYTSGFRYVNDLNLYRWLRQGEGAADAAGEAVYADAVLVARTLVRPVPDDPLGRLYIPIESGPATLYLRGRAVEGHWRNEGGIRFATALGEPVDLTPFKTWVMFAPNDANLRLE